MAKWVQFCFAAVFVFATTAVQKRSFIKALRVCFDVVFGVLLSLIEVRLSKIKRPIAVAGLAPV